MGDGVPLRQHVYAIVGLIVGALLLLQRERDKAVTTALEANERRLDGMNEFRASLKDQGATFITRKEAEARNARSTATVIAVVGLLVAAAALLIPLSR